MAHTPQDVARDAKLHFGTAATALTSLYKLVGTRQASAIVGTCESVRQFALTHCVDPHDGSEATVSLPLLLQHLEQLAQGTGAHQQPPSSPVHRTRPHQTTVGSLELSGTFGRKRSRDRDGDGEVIEDPDEPCPTATARPGSLRNTRRGTGEPLVSRRRL